MVLGRGGAKGEGGRGKEMDEEDSGSRRTCQIYVIAILSLEFPLEPGEVGTASPVPKTGGPHPVQPRTGCHVRCRAILLHKSGGSSLYIGPAWLATILMQMTEIFIAGPGLRNRDKGYNLVNNNIDDGKREAYEGIFGRSQRPRGSGPQGYGQPGSGRTSGASPPFRPSGAIPPSSSVRSRTPRASR